MLNVLYWWLSPMLPSWQSKNDVCTNVLEDHHQLISLSSRKEMEHGKASVSIRRGGQHSQVSLQVRLIRSSSRSSTHTPTLPVSCPTTMRSFQRFSPSV